MADIFVSYSSDDRGRVEPLVGLLQSAGYSVWWDRQIQGGTLYSETIESEAREASLIVVVWSENSRKSQWVADEAEMGRSAGKMLPVRLDDINPPIGFRQIQTIDFVDWNGEANSDAFGTLKKAIAHHIGASDASASPTQKVSDASIAVLPFVNMSSDPEQEYFSDGISEELLNLLSKIRQMRVTARTSSFSFKGSDKRMEEIGELLGVAHILEGSVRKAGDRVRITAQLIETATGFHLWSETYDRTLDDIFAIQDEISAAIVKALKETILKEAILDGGETGDVAAPVALRTTSVEAYEQYLQGQQLAGKRTMVGLEDSRVYYKQALALDPNYFPAVLGLADAHLLLSNAATCYGTTPVAKARADALPLLEKAILLDANSAELYTVLSRMHEMMGNYRQAREQAENAISISPNFSLAFRALALCLKASGDPAAPIVETRRKALALDPLSNVEISNLAGEYVSRGRFDEAMELGEKLVAENPSSPFYWWQDVSILMCQGRFGEVMAPYNKSRDLTRLAWGLPQLLIMFGYIDEAERINLADAFLFHGFYGSAEDANRIGPNVEADAASGSVYDEAISLALWHAQEGRYERALKYLEPYNESDPQEWGRHFDVNYDCVGARVSWLAHTKLGNQAKAGHFASKLKEYYEVRLSDPDGIHRVTYHLGAIVALIEGDRQKALDEMERQLDYMPGQVTKFRRDPLLSELSDEPRYQAVVDKAKALIDEGKQIAIEAGHLPPSEEFLVVATE